VLPLQPFSKNQKEFPAPTTLVLQCHPVPFVSSLLCLEPSASCFLPWQLAPVPLEEKQGGYDNKPNNQNTKHHMMPRLLPFCQSAQTLMSDE